MRSGKSVFTLLIAFCNLPPLTVRVCFTAEMAQMTRSSPATGWGFSCRRRRRISSEASRWAEKWSSTSSGSLSTTRRRIRLSRCTSLQTPYRPFKDIRAEVLAKRRANQCRAFVCFSNWGVRPLLPEHESLRWSVGLRARLQTQRCWSTVSQPRRRGLCALIKLWRLLRVFANWNEHLPERLIASKVFPQSVVKLSVWGGWMWKPVRVLVPGLETVIPAAGVLLLLYLYSRLSKVWFLLSVFMCCFVY